MSDLLSHLNPEQRRAVEYIDGPLLVLAGPGSGKTRVITHRIAHEIGTERVAPERLLGITFTVRAAEEMKSRVRTLLGEDVRPRLGTFHWMCHGLLRRYSTRLGRRQDFRLLTPSEARRVFRRAVGGGAVGSAMSLAAAVSALKNGGAPREVAARHRLDVTALIAARHRYESELVSANALDLDDLLDLSCRLLREDDSLREHCRGLYDEMLIDEYQDTNPIQQALVRLLAPHTGRVVAVGDEDQAIYGWRQADSKAMQRFLTDFPMAAVVKLDRSYRSTKHILRAASSLVGHNEGRLGLALRAESGAGERPVCFVAGDEMEEAEWVAEEIERLVARGAYEWKDVAVLYRVNAQSRVLEDALVRHRIPYHIHAGARFYDRPEVRSVLAYLRLAVGADDEAASWLAARVPGVGERRLDALVESAARQGQSLLDAFGDPPSGLPGGAISRLRSIRAEVLRLRAQRDAPLGAIVDEAIRTVLTELEESAPAEIETATENLGELRSIVKELGARRLSLSELIDRLTLGDATEQRTSGVTLMTIHAAKGLEFPVVFLVGVEEGLIPHRRANDESEIAEERRLCYVAMTRARDLLCLSYAHARLLGGHASIGQRSRFITEMGPANLTVRVSPRTAARPRLASVRPGERVVHPRWKAGTVVGVEGKGRDTLVTIEFDGVGRQRLQLCHAPLRRLNGDETDVLAG